MFQAWIMKRLLTKVPTVRPGKTGTLNIDAPVRWDSTVRRSTSTMTTASNVASCRG